MADMESEKQLQTDGEWLPIALRDDTKIWEHADMHGDVGKLYYASYAPLLHF